MSFNTYSREPMTLDQLTALATAEGWTPTKTGGREIAFTRKRARLAAWEHEGHVACEFRGEGGDLGEKESELFDFE